MNDTNDQASEKKDTSKKLSSKKVKRQLERISAGSDPRRIQKQKAKLAVRILEQIAAGGVKNPAALAAVYVEAAGGAVDVETSKPETV